MTQEEKLKEARKLYKDANEAQRYVLEQLFPELKESEEKDENNKIRKWIRKELESKYVIDNIINNVMADKALAWLEKQGEQKPSEYEDREYACQSSEHYTQRELMIYNLGIADGKRMIEDTIKETEQKSSWSEEDEKMVESIITDIKYCKKVYNNYAFHENEIGWLKSIKDRVQPQPKQEWSERDKLMLETSIDFIKSSPYPYSGDIFRGEISKVEAENWLKSLKDRVQPQSKQEWSEEDESMHTRCIGILGKCYMGELPIKVEEELNWLKSLKPQNTWKPTDEQMYALDNARHSNPFDIHILDTLFHDLYKII